MSSNHAEKSRQFTFEQGGNEYVFVTDTANIFEIGDEDVGRIVETEAESVEWENEDERDPRTLETLYVMLTSQCNLDCSYCYEQDCGFLRQRGEMDVETLDEIFGALENGSWSLEDGGSLVLFGGEPTLEPDLVRRATERMDRLDVNLRREIVTNGYEMPDWLPTFLAENDFNVTVSFDGPPEVHNANRRTFGDTATYSNVRETVKRLQAAGVDPAFQATVTDQTKSDRSLAELLDHFRDLDFRAGVVYYNVFTRDFGQKDVELLTEMVEKSLESLLTDRPLLLGRVKPRLSKLMREEIQGPQACGAGESLLTVDPRGHVYPCHAFAGYDDFHIGELDSVSEEALYETNDRFGENAKELHPTCQNCWALTTCDKRCFLGNYREDGDIGGFPDARCAAERAISEAVVRFVTELMNDEEKLQTVRSNLQDIWA